MEGRAESPVWPPLNESGADEIKRGLGWSRLQATPRFWSIGFYSERGSPESVLNRAVTYCDTYFKRITLPAVRKLDCRVTGVEGE